MNKIQMLIIIIRNWDEVKFINIKVSIELLLYQKYGSRRIIVAVLMTINNLPVLILFNYFLKRTQDKLLFSVIKENWAKLLRTRMYASNLHFFP